MGAARWQDALRDDRKAMWVHADMRDNSWMRLPEAYPATLVPAFADLAMSEGSTQWAPLWELSRWIAAHSHPEEFLFRLWPAWKEAVRGRGADTYLRPTDTDSGNETSINNQEDANDED
jgi:hypothetical protein